MSEKRWASGCSWAGLDLREPRVMGILNVTPDSFSDGGRHVGPDAAIAAGLVMAAAGADIIDVGGESTRPGAAAVEPELELDRILPVVRALAAAAARVSVDTRNAATMQATLAAGASIINDVSGLRHDPAAAAVVAAFDCPVVLMHMRGTPATMQRMAQYSDVVAEVRAELLLRVQAATAAGVRADRIVIDPGIGFAKRAEHAVALLQGLPELAALGFPILVGLSRKAFIEQLARARGRGRAGSYPSGPNPAGSDQAGPDQAGPYQAGPEQRLGGSLAAGLFAIAQGASILRVHDVLETAQAVRIWHSLSG